MKKGSNNKSLISSYLPTQEEFKNLCFISAVQIVCELWQVSLRHIKMIVYAINIFLLILSQFIVKKGDTTKNLTHHCILLSMASMMAQIATLYIIVFVCYSGFRKRL